MKRFSLIVLISLITSSASAQAKPKPVSDSVQIRSVIMTFYNWYNSNWKKMNAFELYNGKKEKNYFLPPYKVNWKEAERYFSYVRKNVPHLGEAFIEQERKHFQWADSMFKVEPDSELPPGFDYDRFTNSQEEPEYLLNELKRKQNRWNITASVNTATVTVQSFDAATKTYSHLYCAEMKKEKGKWKIAKTYCIIEE